MDNGYRPRRRIEERAAHVWHAQLQMEPSTARTLSELLSPDESFRAQRFRFVRDYETYVVSRGLLRLLLSYYLDLPPPEIRFIYGPYGKPALAPECGRLEFNLSHSKGLVAYVFSPHREVGVDIEFVCPKRADWQVARQCFSLREIESLQKVPSELFTEAFFACWTRKEAYIKARGVGVSLALDQFDVSVEPGEQPALLGSRENPQEASRWTFKDLNLVPEFKGALAVEGHNLDVEFFRWPDDCIAAQSAHAGAIPATDGLGKGGGIQVDLAGSTDNFSRILQPWATSSGKDREPNRISA